MKLLLDQNISHRLSSRLKSFPESKHLIDCGLLDATDKAIWNYAVENNYAIVSFDQDFFQMANLKGVPPKIIWIRTGNLNTKRLAQLLEDNFILIEEFLTREYYKDIACLELDF